MTIAACYVSPEGVVLGADSTSSIVGAEGMHYYNFTQKLFELGEGATLGAVTWGLGSLPGKSYRTLFADFADKLRVTPAATVAEVVNRWIDLFWPEYSSSSYLQQFATLHAKPPFDKNAAPPDPNARTEEEELLYANLKEHLVVGFCIGGRVDADRAPAALYVTFDPLKLKPTPTAFSIPGVLWWGVPNMIQRLLLGYDSGLKAEIMNSGKWNGTSPQLQQILDQFMLGHSLLPIRDAIDFVHSCIYSTIKGLKFSNLSQTCGGPIEIAVITTDRRFRWVRHKSWDMAITDGDPR